MSDKVIFTLCAPLIHGIMRKDGHFLSGTMQLYHKLSEKSSGKC